MNDYSDVLFLIGSMAIYALLVTNASRAMFYNNQFLATTEMEYNAVSVAQDVVEKIRWMKYDQVRESNKNTILEDVKNNPNFKDYDIDISVFPVTIPESEKDNKQVDIKVSSPFINNGKNTVQMSFIKTNR